MKNAEIISKIAILIIAHFSFSNSIDHEVAQKIGMLIWQNEADKREDLLVFWNPHESFPSLGIGHFIWYVEGKSNGTEPFAKLCNYLKKNGVELSDWLNKAKKTGAPWNSREVFLEDKKRVNELRKLLVSTIGLQTNFIIGQFEEQWPLIVKACPENHRNRIQYYFELMRTTFLGTYSLIDYLNFKGSGISINSQWGLLQVLLEMPENVTKENVNNAFAISAAQILVSRIKNSYPKYPPIRFLNGWIKRVSSYANFNTTI